MTTILAIALAGVALASLLLAPRARNAGSFFRGANEVGSPPGLVTLVLSQVTTWIFARSLMNAAILGYYYGIVGTLAYAAYYLSFVTGALIIDGIRFRHGASSVQAFLRDRFGAAGVGAYNVVVAVRLLSEVFANLLVVGLLFGAAGSGGYIVAVVAMALAGLGYAMLGGLRASLRTDVLQASLLIALLFGLVVQLGLMPEFEVAAVIASSPDVTDPGWVLLAVALLQIWSYPLHDPVMIDRGFLADQRTTRLSFLHAGWLSALCIITFGLVGVFAGIERTGDEAMVQTLERLFPAATMVAFNVALIVSAMSTLDSTLSSAAKLTVVDMRLAPPTVANGRLAMALFMLGGLAFLFSGSNDLFAAVAVSGTASMFLAPVVVVSVWMGRRDVPAWSFLTAFAAALAGATIYFLESSGYVGIVGPLAGLDHKYSQLLAICVVVLAVGFCAFAVGAALRGPRTRMANGTG